MSTELRRHNLFDLELELVALTNELLNYEGEEPPEELLNAIVGGITATAAKRDRVAAYLRFVESQPKMIDAEIKRLKERKQAIERGVEHLRGYVYRVMQSTNQRVMEGEHSTFKIIKNPPSVDVSDEAALPDDLVDLTITFKVTRLEYQDIKGELADLVQQLDITAAPDKKQIAKLLKDKVVVPGANLKHTERLEIR